jgi:hypothetical protein
MKRYADGAREVFSNRSDPGQITVRPGSTTLVANGKECFRKGLADLLHQPRKVKKLKRLAFAAHVTFVTSGSHLLSHLSQVIDFIQRLDFRYGQSLYPALRRLESEGLIKAEWKASENNRRACYYKLTRTGRKHLRQIEDEWRAHTAVIESFLAFEE